MAKYSPWIGKKISKLRKEGKSHKAAIGQAIGMARQKGLKAPAPLKQKAYRSMLRRRKS